MIFRSRPAAGTNAPPRRWLSKYGKRHRRRDVGTGNVKPRTGQQYLPNHAVAAHIHGYQFAGGSFPCQGIQLANVEYSFAPIAHDLVTRSQPGDSQG